jgi:RimJ/RimL family protein N-acetyltransferase
LRAYWRQGYGSEAAAALVKAGFDVIGLHRIFAECDTANRGSWAVMKKVGLRREGLLRHGRFVKGSWRDRYLYARLSSD